MSTLATIDAKAAPSQELLQMIINLSLEEIVNFRRLLDQAEHLKLNGNAGIKPRRFIDPDDGGPVWELDLIDDFDRASCYEDTRYEL